MTSELFMKIVAAIITIVVALTSAYVVPWLKIKIGGQNFDVVTKYIYLAVKAAEQIFTVEQWAEKKQYVVNYINNIVKSLGITITAEQIDALIEGAVNDIKKQREVNTATDAGHTGEDKKDVNTGISTEKVSQ